MRIVMIFVSESVWIFPSFSLQRPRTVIMSGRFVRSTLNFSSKAWRNSSLHLLDQLRKRGAVGYLAQRKAAGPADPWIVFLDRRARLGLDELWNDQKIEWLTRERRVPKSVQIEHRKHWPTLHEEAGISSALPLDESPYYSSATRTRVAMMRLPATNVPRNVPETF